MEIGLIFRLAAFVFLMFLSACFSASETAFFSLGRVRVQALRKEGKFGERISVLLDQPRRLIISILMGNEIVNIISAAIFTGGLIFLMGESRGWIAPLLMTPLLMVFGEITPKSLAARFPEKFAKTLVIPLSLFMRIIFPLRWVFLHIANWVLSFFGTRNMVQGNILMEDEFLTLVEAGLEEGELDATEQTYIRNIFEFHDRTVGEIIVPRTDMECWEIGLPLREVAGLVQQSAFSRVPVYEGDRDHIIGILYLKDFLEVFQQESIDPDRVLTKKMLRDPLFVPEGSTLDSLFRLLRQERTHMAVVADEFGGVNGLVTMTDLLDEIFGEIRDEFDEKEEIEIEKQTDDSFICVARLPLWEFSEHTGWAVPEDFDSNSIGGFVFTLLGHVPVVGESVRFEEIEFTVLEVDNTRVLKLRANNIGSDE
ncbi:MAG: HlyC/CorC family transporter [Nitrospinaceae bacterium]|nr:HlyC/CorC family transporter [Nitrospinaceae bacterium]MBT3433887.1 HlyC/CorC family transporter [Nitrospinaceae bacterium]MBT3823183.1 HlyC/CorC family transporter [Nitrospinaceae bacterium]MBT4093095.1 HlyC/CorC family transporter [Nitrospinaceae bacterium]MBT4429028.1 HlyC/CorC family transporter [Nitrospinaceae bacterium]